MADADKWQPKDMTYTSVVGTVMLMALLEWVMWLAASLYCLFKVFRKAEERSVKVLSFIVGILFTLLRQVVTVLLCVTLIRSLTTNFQDDIPAHHGRYASSTRLITLLQDLEYVHGKLSERTVESACGSVTCLPGALTMLRFSAFRRMVKYYFANEVCMLTGSRLWRRYPVLIVIRFMQNTIRTTALLFFIMVLALATTAAKVRDLPVGFIGVSLGLNWLLMFYFGTKLRRFKIWMYPLMFVLSPFLNWNYMVYGIFTAGQRTWGGPRADAAAADVNTTAQQAIQQAEEQGDDLNVVPETFGAAAEGQQTAPALGRQKSVVRPPDKLVGRFVAARGASTSTLGTFEPDGYRPDSIMLDETSHLRPPSMLSTVTSVMNGSHDSLYPSDLEEGSVSGLAPGFPPDASPAVAPLRLQPYEDPAEEFRTAPREDGRRW
ncbi:hypothetical protein MY1884_009035 [Beauveria asiatica]